MKMMLRTIAIFLTTILASAALTGNSFSSVQAATPVYSSLAADAAEVVHGVSVFEWPNGDAALHFLVKTPSTCLSSGSNVCNVFVKDSSGVWVAREEMRPGRSFLWAELKGGIDLAFSNGPLVFVFGTSASIPRDEALTGPPSGFLETSRFNFNKNNVADLQCNPLHELMTREYTPKSRQSLMGSFMYAGREGGGELLSGANVGLELDGVTQTSAKKWIQYGYPQQGQLRSTAFPNKGLYQITYDGLDWFPVTLDCTSMRSVTYTEFQPFRMGKDGVIMYFYVLDGYPTSNVWVTISGKKYQIKRSGRYVVPSGGLFKRCDAIVRGFYMGDVTCFVPKRAGTYTIGVTEQYQGSGNLIVKCRSGFYSGVTCSTSRDRSVTAKATGKFKIAANGIVNGPDWWGFNRRD